MRFVILASDLIPGEALPDHLRRGQLEAVEVIHILAEIVAVGLFIKVTE